MYTALPDECFCSVIYMFARAPVADVVHGLGFLLLGRSYGLAGGRIFEPGNQEVDEC